LDSTWGLRSCEPLMLKRAEQFHWHYCAGPIPPGHYDEAIQWVAERARAIEGALALYDLGPIRHPGLSDVDLLLVLDDHFRDADRLRRLLYREFPARFKNVLLHDLYFIRRQELAFCFKWAPIRELNARWREDELPGRMLNEDPTDLALFLLDIITDAYPWEFIQYLERPELDEREVIGRLKGLGYCVDLLRRVGGRPSEESRAFAEDIERLRERLFELSHADRAEWILRLTQQAVAVSYQLALEADRAVRERWDLKLKGRLVLHSTRVAALYADPAPDGARYGRVRLRRTDYYTRLPAVYGYLVRKYASQAGPVSRRLGHCMVDGLGLVQPPPPSVVKAMESRAYLRNAHQEWLNELGLGLVGFMTFGYRPLPRRGEPPWAKEIAGSLLGRVRERMLRRRLVRL